MRLIRTILITVAVLSLVFGAGASASSPLDQATDRSADELSPGERLSGVIGVEHVDWSAEIDARAFAVGLERAEGERGQASVVGDRVAQLEDRIEELEARQEELASAHEAGEISEGSYRARLATLEAERRHAVRALNRSAAVAADLPAEVLEEHGVDVKAIRELRNHARNLTGQEVADIAQDIGAGLGVDGGPGAIPGNRSDRPPAAAEGEGRRGQD